jgi:hypothetical protein
MNNTIKLYEALKRMRKLTELGIPFSFEFLSYNSTNETSEGFKAVSKAQLRKGYRDDQSDKADILIGYESLNKKRWFYLPLLTKFNDYTIIP